jgi:pterin-4a-carbinolamine dehydratase/ribonuclease HI
MWQETEKGLYKQFEFKDFQEAFSFMQAVASKAERMNHHPLWENEWNRVSIWLSTHSAHAITEKDRELAAAIDQIFTKEQKEEVEEKNTTQITEVKLYGDGGSRGNPGPSASGYVLFDMDGNELVKNGVYLGITTNNQAEYLSLKLGLEHALKYGARTVHVHMDSLLVINQMLGKFKVKNRDLWPIHAAVKDMIPKFKKVTFAHVPRALNKEADAAVNEALDLELKKNEQSSML